MRAAPALALATASATPSGPTRLLVIDALRGLALCLMALNHAAYFVQANIVSEAYLGVPITLGTWPHWMSGLITHMAAPTFWVLSGVSIHLLAANRRKGSSEWQVTRFLLIRSGVLIVLDLLVTAPQTGTLGWRFGYAYDFDILSSLGVSVALMTVLRLLPTPILAPLMLALLTSYQWLVTHALPAAEGAFGFWAGLWLDYGEHHTTPPVWFPVLGWCGLMGLGVVLGRAFTDHKFLSPRAWVVGGMGLMAVWLPIRLAAGYGSIVPYSPDAWWPSLLIMSKGPPSLDYFAFHLAIAAFAFAVLLGCAAHLGRPPLRWLVVCGQASLFFYVVHMPVYRLLGNMALASLPGSVPWIVRYYAVWIAGLAVLVPLARVYRGFRKAHPQSLLQYL